METARLSEGKDYTAEDSPEAIGLKLQAKAAQLRKDNRVEEAEQVDGIYSKAVNYQTTIFKLGTTLANKQAEVAELTKEVMEGYLAANKEFIANAGVFSGIIGTTKKGVTQFFAAGAAHAKALGATVPRSEGGAGSVGGPAPRYESGKGTVSIKGPNPLEAWIAKMGFQPKSGAQIYQQLPEEYLGSAKEEAAKRGISVTEYLDIVNKKSKNKVSSGAGPRTPTPPAKKENRISPYTPEEVSQGLPMGASGGATPSGYVISTPKVDQYKDLVSMLNPSMVQGGVPGKDSVPVAGIGMLMPGEAIVTGDEESAIAEMINEGQIKGMARGGSMGGMGAFGKSYAVGSKNAERNMGGASFGGEGSYAVGSKNAERNMGGARLGTMGARAGSDEWKGNLGMGPIAGSDEWKKNLSKQREESSRLFATKRVEEIEQRVAEKRKRKEDADRLERYNLVHRGSELEQKTNKQIVERNIISGGEGITREQQAKVMAPAGIGGTERQIRIAVAMARKAARVGDWEAASGGYFGGNNGIQVRHMASGGSIQVPRGLAKQFASSGATTTNVFDLSNAAKEFFKATPDIANHRSGTRV